MELSSHQGLQLLQDVQGVEVAGRAPARQAVESAAAGGDHQHGERSVEPVQRPGQPGHRHHQQRPLRVVRQHERSLQHLHPLLANRFRKCTISDL